MEINEEIKNNDTWEMNIFKQKNHWTYWTYKDALIKEITNIFKLHNCLLLKNTDFENIKNFLKNAKIKLSQNITDNDTFRLEVINDLIKECENQTLSF